MIAFLSFDFFLLPPSPVHLEQLDAIALALVRVFSLWGVRECALLDNLGEQQATHYFRLVLTILDDQPGFTRHQVRLKLGVGEELYYEQLARYGLAALF